MRFFHDGQFEGRRSRLPMQLCRALEEPVDAELKAFYERLLRCVGDPAAHDGEWRLVECRAAWEGNPSSDGFIAFAWEKDDRRLLAVVNYAPHQGQCFAMLPFAVLPGTIRLTDLMGPAVYDRDGERLSSEGLYLDLPAWSHHAFELSPACAGEGSR